MKLWILLPLDEDSGPWRPWYDKAFGFVVQAETAEEARQLASESAGDETRVHETVWLDPLYTRCEELLPSGKASIIMRDFHAA